MDGKTLSVGIYLLERVDTAHPDEWSYCVVAAPSEREARQMANEASKAEGYVWTDGSLVTASRLSRTAEDGVQGVIVPKE